jgi:hypothetical protein
VSAVAAASLLRPHRARFLLAKGYEPRYELALEVLKELPYRRWRDANPEDTLRFHALRLPSTGVHWLGSLPVES